MKVLLFLWIMSCFTMLQAQETDVDSVKFVFPDAAMWEHKIQKAYALLLSEIEVISDDSLIVYEREETNKGTVLAVKHKEGTVYYIRFVRSIENGPVGYEVYKVKLKRKINSENIYEVYDLYIKMTIERSGKYGWAYFKKKKLPIEFKGYTFVVLEEYSLKKVSDVLEKLQENAKE